MLFNVQTHPFERPAARKVAGLRLLRSSVVRDLHPGAFRGNG